MKTRAIQLSVVLLATAAFSTYCYVDDTDRSPDTRDREACGDAPSYGQSLRFAVIGDFGDEGDDEAAVAALVESKGVDFIATVGDNNYPDGEASTIDDNIGQYYSKYIGCYKGEYGAGSSSNRFWPSPGNHDWYSGLGPYLDYFTLPGNEYYYDVELGPVHLFMLDSENPSDEQRDWLEQALTSSTACHRLVLFHHAAYSSGNHGSESDMQWPFEEWGATAVIGGHDHSYERLRIGGIPYFVNGLGGRSRYDFESTVDGSEVRYNDDYGAMFVSVEGSSITYEFVNVEGTVIDTFSESFDCAPGPDDDPDPSGDPDPDDGPISGGDPGPGGDSSCSNRCEQEAAGCWCDYLCPYYDDCCSDYESLCT